MVRKRRHLSDEERREMSTYLAEGAFFSAEEVARMDDESLYQHYMAALTSVDEMEDVSERSPGLNIDL